MAIIKANRRCESCSCKNNLFAMLSDEELRKIDESRLEVVYNENETIFKQGTFITHMVSITRGLTKVYLEGMARRNLILQYTKPGELIGGPGAFIDKVHYFSMVAVEETSACLIPVEVFKDIMLQNNKFAMGYIEDISKKGIYNFNRFISLTQKQMHGRVADALLYLHTVVYKNIPDGILLNRKDIADLTALSKDSAGRILNAFEESSLIKIDSNRIHILNLEQLEEISIKG